MAKKLVFIHGGDEIAMAMVKVDRSKLYGYKEQLVLDKNDQPCELVTLAGDGSTVAHSARCHSKEGRDAIRAWLEQHTASRSASISRRPRSTSTTAASASTAIG